MMSKNRIALIITASAGFFTALAQTVKDLYTRESES